ncbi:response regulator [bacterium]|nr:response regulator [bacterium]
MYLEGNQVNIFVVEDEPLLLAIYVAILKDNFPICHITGFSDSLCALENIRSDLPNVIITDYLMPKLSGIDLLKETRVIDWDVKIILMSGSMNDSVINQASYLGVNMTLTKPIDFVDISNAVISCLALSPVKFLKQGNTL